MIIRIDDTHVSNYVRLMKVLTRIREPRIKVVLMRNFPIPGPWPNDLDLLISEADLPRFVDLIQDHFEIIQSKPRVGKLTLEIASPEASLIKLDLHLDCVANKYRYLPANTVMRLASTTEFGHYIYRAHEVISLLMHDILGHGYLQLKHRPRILNLLASTPRIEITQAVEETGYSDLLRKLFSEYESLYIRPERVLKYQREFFGILPKLTEFPTLAISIKSEKAMDKQVGRFSNETNILIKLLARSTSSVRRINTLLTSKKQTPPRKIKQGVFVVFVGPHGAGKSTTGKAIIKKLEAYGVSTVQVKISPYSGDPDRVFPPKLPRRIGWAIKRIADRDIPVRATVRKILDSDKISPNKYILPFKNMLPGSFLAFVDPLPMRIPSTVRRLLHWTMGHRLARVAAFLLAVPANYILELGLYCLILPDQIGKQRRAVEAAKQGKVVVSDRYTDDLVIGARYRKTSRHNLIRSFIQNLSIEPDLRYVLATDLRSLRKRKDEIPDDGYERAIECFLNLGERNNSYVIDTSRPAELIVSEIEYSILSRLS